MRDPGRAPLPWNASRHGGFTTGKPWLPLHHGYPSRNVEAQGADPDSVFQFYRRLIALRRPPAGLRAAPFHNLTRRPARGWAYLRQAPGERALVALNFYARPLGLALDRSLPAGGWRLAISS